MLRQMHCPYCGKKWEEDLIIYGDLKLDDFDDLICDECEVKLELSKGE